MAGLLIGAVLCSVFGVHSASHCDEHRQTLCGDVESQHLDCSDHTGLPSTDDHSGSCDCLCQTMIHVAVPTLVMDPEQVAILIFADPPLHLKSVVLEFDPPPVRRA